jgi:hypothetical protein
MYIIFTTCRSLPPIGSCSMIKSRSSAVTILLRWPSRPERSYGFPLLAHLTYMVYKRSKQEPFKPPGVVSALFLILFASLLSVVFTHRKQQFTIKHMIPGDHLHENSPICICQRTIDSTVRAMKQIQYTVGHKLDSQTIEQHVKHLQASRGYSTLLVFKMKENDTYGDFVSLVNFAMKSKLKRYYFMNDRMYFFPNLQKKAD